MMMQNERLHGDIGATANENCQLAMGSDSHQPCGAGRGQVRLLRQ